MLEEGKKKQTGKEGGRGKEEKKERYLWNGVSPSGASSFQLCVLPSACLSVWSFCSH